MPYQLLIGTQKDIHTNNAYVYTKQVIGSVTIYLCDKGSQYSRPGEILLLRKEDDGSWVAWDSDLTANKKHFSAVKQFSVAGTRTLQSQEGINGKPMPLPATLTSPIFAIGTWCIS